MSGAFEWMTVASGQLQSAGALDGIDSMAKTKRGYTLTTDTGTIESAYFILKPNDNHSRVRLISASTGYRQYTGAVHFYWHANQWHVALWKRNWRNTSQGCSSVKLEKGHAPELYTAHAAVSRTYALNTYGRHRLAGYDVCDQVHCQAFDGMSTVNDTIRQGMPRVKAFGHLRSIGAAHSGCIPFQLWRYDTQFAEPFGKRPLPHLASRPRWSHVHQRSARPMGKGNQCQRLGGLAKCSGQMNPINHVQNHAKNLDYQAIDLTCALTGKL